jgi:hypothetical protein
MQTVKSITAVLTPKNIDAVLTFVAGRDYVGVFDGAFVGTTVSGRTFTVSSTYEGGGNPFKTGNEVVAVLEADFGDEGSITLADDVLAMLAGGRTLCHAWDLAKDMLRVHTAIEWGIEVDDNDQATMVKTLNDQDTFTGALASMGAEEREEVMNTPCLLHMI